MWFPRWLGETYAKLYANFHVETFTFNEAKEVLNAEKEPLNVAFSKLHSFRALYVHARTKPRLYRIIKPESFILAAAGRIKNLNGIKQERYLQLICDVVARLVKEYEATSVCVYGSIARGSARPDSDLDLLVVSDGFKGSLTSRIEKLCQVEEEVADELKRLKKYGVNTGLSFYPLRREEVLRFPLILLDLTVDGVIVHDQELFLEKALTLLKTRLAKQGAKRVFIDEDTWYWDLKPDYKFGEDIEI